MPLGLPDPRPSKAHPDHRAARKKLEKEHDAFENYTMLGMKVGVMALLCAAAVIGEAKYDEHKEKERDRENRERRDRGGDRDRDRDRDRNDRSRGRDRDRRRSNRNSRSRSSNESTRRVRWGTEDDIAAQKYGNPRDYDRHAYDDRRQDRKW
ncbi:hypothetical protein F5884DRAFT_756472 [Xylogone sp. PMI_703]|nr:hypothetical protein F5884DRAFT_756472 [Xylogone sp. PMI_703]